MKAVLASGSAGKLKEFAALLAPLRYELVTQTSLGIEPIEETGNSFLENALLKARNGVQHSGLPTLADDSGLEVDALGGRPGIYSARYAGIGAQDADNLNQLLDELRGVPAPRTARYRCALVWMDVAGVALTAEGCWEGAILAAPRGVGGFGYDPVFLPRGDTRTAAELPAAEKNDRSHRGQALAALLTQLRR